MSNALRPLLLIFALALALPVQAQDEAREPPSERELAGDRVRQVERDGGRVLQAQPMQRSGREVYRLKVLTPEGRVRVLDNPRGREPRPGSADRGRFNRDAGPRAMPVPRENRYRPAESRGEPSPRRSEGPRPEPAGGERGERTPL